MQPVPDAGERQSCNGDQLVASQGNEACLETFRRAEHDDGRGGIATPELVGRREQRVDVSRRSPPARR